MSSQRITMSTRGTDRVGERHGPSATGQSAMQALFFSSPCNRTREENQHPTAKSTNPIYPQEERNCKRRCVSSRAGADKEKQKSCDGAKTNVCGVMCQLNVFPPLFASDETMVEEVESHSSQSILGPFVP